MKYAECTLTSNENEGVTLGDAMTKSGNRNAISKDCHKKVIKKNHYGESVSFNVVLRVSGRPEKLKSISPQYRERRDQQGSTLLPLRHDALDEYISLQQFGGNDEGAIVPEVLVGKETGEHAPRAVMDDDSCADEALFAHSLHAERGAARMPETCSEGLFIGEKHLSVPLEVGHEHHAWGRGGFGIAPTITTGKGTIAWIHLLGNGITQTNIIHIGHERNREAVR